MLQGHKGRLGTRQITSLKRAGKLGVVLLNLLGRSLRLSLGVALQLRKFTLRLRQITGLKILSQRGKIGLEGAGATRRSLTSLYQLQEIVIGRLSAC